MFRLKSAGLANLLLVAGVALILSVPASGQRSEHSGLGDRDQRRHEDDREPKDENRQQRVRIVIENVAVSAWEDGKKVGAQMQLMNIGSGDAREVRITRVEVSGGRYIGPNFLPVSVGELASGHFALFDSVFEVPADGSPRLLRVNGEYVRGKERSRFSADAAIAPDGREPGPFTSMPGEAVVQDPNSAVYPPPSPPTAFAPNAEETPVLIPLGPQQLFSEPTSSGTDLAPGPGIVGGPGLVPDNPSGGDPLVLFQRNTRISRSTTAPPPDPNAAAQSPDGVVLVTYNLGVSYSTDGGETFTDVNLLSPQPGNPRRTSFFPESDGGLCCDQVVVYIPAQNLFVWLLEYNPMAPNRLRIAWASPDGIRADFWNAWTYVDLTGANVAGVSSGLGLLNTESMDYGDLAWSGVYLYVSAIHKPANAMGQILPGYRDRRIVARLLLADIANPAVPVVHYNFTEFTGCSSLKYDHFVQGAPGRMVVGCLDNQSQMFIYTWRDGANPDSRARVAIPSVRQGNSYTSMDPDGIDWLGDFNNGKDGSLGTWPGMISGATFRPTAGGDEYLFAFQAGQNPPRRPQAYVRLQSLTPRGSGYARTTEYDIWNANYAYAMAALGSDGGEIGINLAVGGGTVGYPQMAVGYKDDFVVYQVTQNNGTQRQPDGHVRFGDYLSVRPIPANISRFGAAVYDVTLPSGAPSGSTCLTVTCSANARFVEFGRLIE
jgi:hypothetical protein